MHRLPRSEASVGHDGGLFEREAVRLRGQLGLRRPGVLGERAPTGSVHLVTDVKSVHVLPTASTRPATLVPGTGIFGARNPNPRIRMR
jgi:hypothetical protein